MKITLCLLALSTMGLGAGCGDGELYDEHVAARTSAYTDSGNRWPHPERISVSFVPDGTNVAGIPSDLFARWNGRYDPRHAHAERLPAARRRRPGVALILRGGADGGPYRALGTDPPARPRRRPFR